MVEDVLVKDRTLSHEELVTGKHLLELLDSARFPIVAAYWIYTSERDYWQLEIVTPEVDRHGPLKVYLTMHDIVDESIDRATSARLNLFNVLGASYSFYQDMLKAFRTEKPLSNYRYSNLVVGGDLADVYFYRFPATSNKKKELIYA